MLVLRWSRSCCDGDGVGPEILVLRHRGTGVRTRFTYGVRSGEFWVLWTLSCHPSTRGVWHKHRFYHLRRNHIKKKDGGEGFRTYLRRLTVELVCVFVVVQLNSLHLKSKGDRRIGGVVLFYLCVRIFVHRHFTKNTTNLLLQSLLYDWMWYL